MNTLLRSLPNALSTLRLALVPLLWIFALQGRLGWVGVGLLVAGATDVLDGQLARRLNAVTPEGARLDSLADNLLALSGAAWLLLLRPDVVAAFWPVLLLWLVCYLAFLTVGVVKFRQVGNLHLYSGKASAVFEYAFLVHCMLLPGIPVVLFFTAAAISMLSLAEGLALQLLSDDVDERTGSLLLVMRRRAEGVA
jgi:phosphatidylglycerophosphate synthase